MLDYFISICQTKKVIFIAQAIVFFGMVSCGTTEKPHLVDKIPARPVWFNTDIKYSDRVDGIGLLPHPFFDLVPFSSTKTNMVNFVVLTPEGSDKRYQIDLKSGKMFSHFHVCKQNDVWNNYSGSIYKPNYTEGFIPRLLDQAGMPQKIIVFGGKDAYKRSTSNAIGAHRVRVVGGVIEQRCEKYPCLQNNEWLGRIVLVAVDPTYEQFRFAENLYDLKKVVDFKYAMAYMANASGRTFDRGQELPYIRIVDEIDATEALSFAIQKGYLYKFDDMMKLRNTCHELYDYVWKKVTELRFVLDKLKDKEWIDKVVRENLEKQAKKKKIETKELIQLRREVIEKRLFDVSKNTFPLFFHQFYKDFKDKFSVCTKYVKSSNILEDVNRHWFFAYLEGFFLANDVGYIYSCSKKEWFKNYRDNLGKWAINQKDELKKCSTLALDDAFKKLPTLFGRLMNDPGSQFFRYVTYDFFDGSHEKLYSWVKVSSKKISCKSEPDSIWRRIQGMLVKETNTLNSDEEEYIFPTDVTWNPFYVPDIYKEHSIN